MVFLLTPDGEFRQLPCPGTITIGRNDDNNIVERHRTVSGNHCKIIVEPIAGIKNKVQMWLEDCKSMNGTYVGASPLEIEKVIGRTAIHTNWYFRIGHLTKYFQIVEHIPLDADIVVPELTILPKDGKGRMGTRTMGASVDLVLPEIKASTLPKLDIPPKPASSIDGRPGGTVHFAEESPVVVGGGSSSDSVLPALAGTADVGAKASEGVRPLPQLASAEAKSYTNPPSSQSNSAKGTAFGALKLPAFRVYDKLKEGSLLKYLDLLDQWKDQLISIKDHILKGNADLDRYMKAILAKSYRAKQSKKGRYQGRYLYLANPKVVDKDRDAKESKGDTPRETLLAELVAESMSRQLGSEGGVYDCTEGVLNGLHELLTHCFLGAQIGPTFVENMSDENKELDFLLQNELLTVLQSCILSAQSLQSSALISSITEYYRQRENPCEMASIVEECVTIMRRVAAFIVKSDEIVNEEFSVGEYYEVVLMCVSTVVEEFYDAYTVLLTLSAEAEQATVTHSHANKGSKQVHSTRLVDSYNEEVEEMRQMKYDADLLSLLERVREQEAGLISEKFKRIAKVLDIFTKQQLFQGFRKWKHMAKDLKRKDLKRFDFMEKVQSKTKRMHWIQWRKAFQRRRTMAKCLFRLTRAIGYNMEKVKRIYWEFWKRNTYLSPRWARGSDSLAQLKLSVLQLQAQVQEQANNDHNIAALAAEKALNRELTATNNELRQSVQNLQLQLMEMCNVSLAKRRDVVLHSLLDKEEEVARSKKEVKLLRAELEQLRNIVQQQHDKNPRIPKREEDDNEYKTPTIKRSALPASKGMVSDDHWRLMNSDNSYQQGYSMQKEKKVPVSKLGAMMSKQEAVQIVLMEVRRLKDSMKKLQTHRDELKAIAAEEMQKRLDQAHSSQQMSYRLIDLERSASALRELLKQRVGLNAYTDLVVSLESMGVGAHVLQTSAQHTIRDPELVTNILKDYKAGMAKKKKEDSAKYDRAVEDAFN